LKNETAAAAKATSTKILPQPSGGSALPLSLVVEERQDSFDNASVATTKRRRSATELPAPFVYSIQVIECKLQQIISSIQSQNPPSNPTAKSKRHPLVPLLRSLKQICLNEWNYCSRPSSRLVIPRTGSRSKRSNRRDSTSTS
jgi:hypothetical protein